MIDDGEDTGDLLEQLLRQCLNDALKGTVDIETRAEILKIGGAFWIARMKAKAKEIEDESDHPTFVQFKQRIAGLGGGHG